MKIVEMTVSEGATISIAKFEFFKYDVSATGKADGGERKEDVVAALQTFVHGNLQQRLNEVCDELSLDKVPLPPPTSATVKRVHRIRK